MAKKLPACQRLQIWSSLCMGLKLKYNLGFIPEGRQWRAGYERIIRNGKELFAIRQYIKSNPENWAEDKNNPFNIK